MAEPTDAIDHVDIYDPEQVALYEQQQAQGVGAETDEIRQMLNRRRVAYVRVFTDGKREAADVDIVLSDLMWFCRAWTPSYDVRDGIHAETLAKMKDGRREVIQRIKDFACLDGDALLIKYTNALTK